MLSIQYLHLLFHNTVDIDDCSPPPCENLATCVDKIDGYSCSCVSGFTGQFCETGESAQKLVF